MKYFPSFVFGVVNYIFFILSFSIVAQNATVIDSLKNELKTANDTSRIKILNDLCLEYNSNYPEKALQYGEQALTLAKQLGFKKGIATSLNNIGEVHRIQGNYKNAMEYYFQSLQISENINYKKGIAASLVNIGNIYVYQSKYEDALTSYLQSYKIREEIGDKLKAAEILANIAAIYTFKNEYAFSLEYLQQSLQIFQELREMNGIDKILNNIGSVYFLKKDYDKALDYFMQSLKINKKMSSKDGIATRYGNISSVFLEQNNFIKAIEYNEKSLVLAKETGLKDGIKQAYGTFAEIYYKQNNYKKAYEYYQLYSAMKDSLLNEESNRAISEMQAKYETEKKQKEIELQKAEIEKKDIEVKQKQTQRNAFIIGFGLTLLLTIVLYSAYTQKKKSKKIIEEKNKNITDSITYAKRIQNAILPSEKFFAKNFKDHFILFIPKDIVSGDFYWTTEKEDKIILAAIDCTGHGVPGAFMSLIGYSLLNQIVKENEITQPAKILSELSKGVQQNLQQQNSVVKDGMDIALCCYDKKNNSLEYSGAYNPLYYFRNNQHYEIKPDKIAIGNYSEKTHYTHHKIELQKNDTIYIFSDGYADQFGGSKEKKFSYKQLRQLLADIHQKPMPEQKTILDRTFTEWKKNLEQTDDVLIIGIKI